jgi:predicted nucleic acid-binding protein
MSFLLDTDICSASMKGHPASSVRAVAAPRCISTIRSSTAPQKASLAVGAGRAATVRERGRIWHPTHRFLTVAARTRRRLERGPAALIGWP